MARVINDKDRCSVLLLCSDFTPRSNSRYGLRHIFQDWARAHLQTSFKRPLVLFPPASHLTPRERDRVMSYYCLRYLFVQLEERKDIPNHNICPRCDASFLPCACSIKLCFLSSALDRTILVLIELGLPHSEFK